MRRLFLSVEFFSLFTQGSKTAIIGLMFLAMQAQAQNSDCSCPEACNPCSGGLISLKLRYNGTPATVQVENMNETLFQGNLVAGEVFSLTGQLPNGRFRSNVINIYVDGDLNAEIGVNCVAGVFANAIIGKFTVVAGESVRGGALCCVNGPYVDTVAPEFMAYPKDIITKADQQCEVAVIWTEPEAKDCGGVILTSNYTSGAMFSIGETEVVYTAADTKSNKSVSSFKVIVYETETPVISNCPGNIFVQAMDNAGVPVFWTPPAATDNCKLEAFEGSHMPGDVFPLGNSDVVYTARDGSGNESHCTFRVSVVPAVGNDIVITPVLTPDGDAINDMLIIENIERYKDNRITIVDRWGNEIYTAHGYDNETVVWKGVGRNLERVSTGTYFYTLVIFSSDGKFEKRGFIELIN